MTEKFVRREKPLKNGGILLLREAEIQDAESVLTYLNRVGGESDNLLFGKNGFSMPLEREQAFLLGLRQQPNSILLLGFAGDELVSVVSLSCLDGRERTAHRAELAVSVRKDHWGLGAGRETMQAMLEFAACRGIEILELQVRADNERAVSLYRSLGFQVIGRYPGFFKLDGVYYDALLMHLTL